MIIDTRDRLTRILDLSFAISGIILMLTATAAVGSYLIRAAQHDCCLECDRIMDGVRARYED